MTYSVYQHWDPLKTCVVGRSYHPEFYSWITKPSVRSLFERIAIETEEDYQAIISKLKEFNVEVLRPDIPDDIFNEGHYRKPPMTPRDYMVMVGDTFYEHTSFNFQQFYSTVRDSSWPDCPSYYNDFTKLPEVIQNECVNIHNLQQAQQPYNAYDKIYQHIAAQGNKIKSHWGPPETIMGAMISRIGRDLYFATNDYNQDQSQLQKMVDSEFTQTRNHVVNTGGHGDGTYCPVCPGLIISLYDVPSYAKTFPDWEVVYLPGQSWTAVNDFLDLKQKNQGRWWIPGFEHDQDVVDTVETWLRHWTGYVEETVFDVNMLIIDPKNVIVFNYNDQVFEALGRYGITPHVVPFRHRYFWDGGIHCVTSDLNRQGTMKDYFK